MIYSFKFLFMFCLYHVRFVPQVAQALVVRSYCFQRNLCANVQLVKRDVVTADRVTLRETTDSRLSALMEVVCYDSLNLQKFAGKGLYGDKRHNTF